MEKLSDEYSNVTRLINVLLFYCYYDNTTVHFTLTYGLSKLTQCVTSFFLYIIIFHIYIFCGKYSAPSYKWFKLFFHTVILTFSCFLSFLIFFLCITFISLHQNTKANFK